MIKYKTVLTFSHSSHYQTTGLSTKKQVNNYIKACRKMFNLKDYSAELRIFENKDPCHVIECDCKMVEINRYPKRYDVYKK